MVTKRLVHIVILLLVGAAAACRPARRSASPSDAKPDSGRAAGALTTAEVAHFDQLVTPHLLFPEPEERARYVDHGSRTLDGVRVRMFELKSEPGMKKPRHFFIVSVAVARAGTFGAKQGEPQVAGLAGPGGSSVSEDVQTPDGKYDLRVSLAMLLPSDVDVRFDAREALQALVQLYVQTISER